MPKRVTLSLLRFLFAVMMVAGVFVTGAFAADNHSGNAAGDVHQSHNQTGHDSGNMGQSGSNGSNGMDNMNGMDMHGMNMDGMAMDDLNSHGGSAGPGGHGGNGHDSGSHSGSVNGASSDEANTPPNWPFIYTIGAINLLTIITAALMKKSALKGNGVN